MIKQLCKKSLTFLIALSLAIPIISNEVNPNIVKAAGGSGTPVDPYIITTATEFNNIRNNTTAYYKLGADINLSSFPSWEPIPPFKGGLDGNGYSISNYKINALGNSYQGLFSDINVTASGQGVIKNLTIFNADVAGATYTGALAGRITGTSPSVAPVIDNVEIHGIVKGDNYSYIGGLAGTTSYTTFTNSYVDVDVNVTQAASSWTSQIGGVFGYSNYLNAQNIITSGNVTVTGFTGGSGGITTTGGFTGTLSNSQIRTLTVDTQTTVNQNNNSNAYSIGGAFGTLLNSFVYTTNVNGKLTVNCNGITATGTSYSCYAIGGLIGYHQNGYGISETLLDITTNIDVTVKTPNPNSSQYNYNIYEVGGVSGRNYINLTKKRLFNSGNVSISTYGNAYRAGGIYGFEYSYSQDHNTNYFLTNTGNISAYSGGNQAYCVGGIAGESHQDTAYNYHYDIVNSGNISASQASGATTQVAGLFGNYGSRTTAVYYGTIIRAINKGAVSGSGHNSLSSTNPAGLVSNFYYAFMYGAYSLNPAPMHPNGYYYRDFANNVGTTANVYAISVLGGGNSISLPITIAQASMKAGYSTSPTTAYPFDFTNNWGIVENTEQYPYLKVHKKIGTTLPKDEFQTPGIPLILDLNGEFDNVSSYEIKVEKRGPTEEMWSSVNTYTSDTKNFTFKTTPGTPENTKFRFYVRTKNVMGVYTQWSVPYDTIFTNNYPFVQGISNDVNGRKMSPNEGFNKIKFSGNGFDFDINDDVSVYYTVKEKDDKVSDKYVLNPSNDTFIKTLTSPVNGADDSFAATYTISNTITHGNWVILVYATDESGGISEPKVIDFVVDTSKADIKFYAEYNGTMLATAPRKIAAKDSELKMYFSAYDYTTFEYAGYLVKANQQSSTGSYTDLKIRGAFTNDVPAKFIGVNLSDSIYENGDLLIFKFRATSSTGVKTEKDVRVLVGDVTVALTEISDSKVPTPLLIQ